MEHVIPLKKKTFHLIHGMFIKTDKKMSGRYNFRIFLIKEKQLEFKSCILSPTSDGNLWEQERGVGF